MAPKPRDACGRGHDLTVPGSRGKPEPGRKSGKCVRCARANSNGGREAIPRPFRGEKLPDGHRRCTGCTAIKTLAEFYKDAKASLGVSPKCKDCCKVDRKNSYHRDAEASRITKVARMYGTTAGWILKQREIQGNVCAICGRVNANGRALSVDHSHKTGQVRALLCSSCNIAIGLFQDHPELLEVAAQYLRTHHPEVETTKAATRAAQEAIA
jgi:hypothetical protein